MAMLKKVGLTLLYIGLFLLMIYLFQFLWNKTMPSIFGLKEIVYWEAVGLVVIARILFGGFGFRWMNNSRTHHFFLSKHDKSCCKLSKEEKEAVITKIYTQVNE